MLQKGTQEYKRAQQIANSIQDYAENNLIIRWENCEDRMYQVCDKVIAKVSGFAAEVAKTVLGTIADVEEGKKCSWKTVARCSSKQSWILACAVVENGIELF